MSGKYPISVRPGHSAAGAESKGANTRVACFDFAELHSRAACPELAEGLNTNGSEACR